MFNIVRRVKWKLVSLRDFFFRKEFVPANFVIPKGLQNEHFRIRPLVQDDAEKDYDAIMSSLPHLQKMFLAELKWPTAAYTLEQNFSELKKEEMAFESRSSFTYTVVSLDEAEVLGCVYINPAAGRSNDADIRLWVRQSSLDSGLDPLLFVAVKKWIASEWCFKSPNYPGR